MYSVTITIIAVLLLCACILLFIRSGYLGKLLFKIGIKNTSGKMNWTAFSWNNCLKKIEYKADIAFFGDSLTHGSEFHKHWDNIKIVNLGCGGDSIQDLINRIYLIETVAPQKIFLLCGINGLTDFNISKCTEKYDELLNKIKKAAPQSTIFVQSVLPVSKSKEHSICHNSSIIKFNESVNQLSKKYNTEYIDLHSHFFLNGEINPKLTKDGIHLSPEGYSLWKSVIEKYIEN